MVYRLSLFLLTQVNVIMFLLYIPVHRLYIVVMISNFALRFSWMFTLMQPPELHGIVSLQCTAERADLKETDETYYVFFAYMGPIITIAEICRRKFVLSFKTGLHLFGLI